MMRPWMVELTLSGLELQRAGFDPELGIDIHYRRKAATNGMALSMLETAAEQIDYLAGLPMDVQVAQLQKTLDGRRRRAEGSARDRGRLARRRRTGDRAAAAEGDEGLARLSTSRCRRPQPPLDSRASNPASPPATASSSSAPPTWSGSDGLIAMLRQKGYRITQQ